jgi:phospho-N-acetylmuramoyl-pentapeptide-transferase
MLYAWLYPFHDEFILFNVFKYITFRSFCAMTTAIILYFSFGARWIEFLKHKQFGQIIREDGPKSHLAKKNTPTMGGVLVVFCVLISTLLWGDLTNPFVWTAIAVMLGFGFVGLIDDLKKVTKKNTLGFRGQYKIIIEVAVCLGAALYLYGYGYLDTTLNMPFFKEIKPDLGVLYLFFAVVVITGTANAVNLTDGLDGLVTVPTLFAFMTYAALVYAAGNAIIAEYLQVPKVPMAGEVAIVCASMIGALLGFLWYNAHPAEIFMGDVGALGIGGLLGTIALISKNEVLLILIGGIFVVETLSVIAQVTSFKLTGKRIFKMAPLHHHFELIGWKEPKVIVRFWIISFLLSMLALATLKLR